MTREELDEQIERAVGGFSSLEGVDGNLAEKLVGEGFLSYDDLSVIEPDALMEMGGLSLEQVDKIVLQAEAKAEEAEAAATEERRRQREQERIDAATKELEAKELAAQELAAQELAAKELAAQEPVTASPEPNGSAAVGETQEAPNEEAAGSAATTSMREAEMER
jgi:N utilization substance protein A